MNKTKVYLGDSVYVELSEFGEVLLTTEDGVSVSNIIIMEAMVVFHLLKWLKENAIVEFPKE